MKKRYLSLLLIAALLTGCSSGNADNGTVTGSLADTAPSAGSMSAGGSEGSLAAESGSSGSYGTASGSVTSAVSGTSGASDVSGLESSDYSAVESAAVSSSGGAAPVDFGSSAAVVPASTTSAKPAETKPITSATPTTPTTPATTVVTAGEYSPTDIGGTGISKDSGFAEVEADVADVAGAEYFDSDIAAVDGFVECPEPIDPIVPIDPIEPYEPWVDPQAGLLTGGEWNDNDHWDFWNSLYQSNNYGVDWADYLNIWRTGMEHRAAVTVRDISGSPVSGAKVTGMGTAAVTDNKGRAYLFWAEPQADGAAEFTVEYGGGTQTFSENVSGDCELEFTLNSAAKPTSKSLDLMIMCDTTGSMGDELEYLKAELEDVVTRIRRDNANLPTRISVNFYRDEGDEYVVREYPFTTDLDAAVGAIAAQSAEGGGDTPEAVHTALKSAVSHDWQGDSVKVMFLVLDAPPHEDAQVIDEVAKYTNEAAENGIRIVPVAASGVDKSCEYLLRSIAMKTGGTYTFLTDDSGIGYGHMEPTIGSYDVEKLNDMMVRIVSGYLE